MVNSSLVALGRRTLCAPLSIVFNGTSLGCDLSADDAKRMNEAYPATAEERSYDLQVRLSMDNVAGLMVALTADQIPFQFRHFEERWFEIKVVEE